MARDEMPRRGFLLLNESDLHTAEFVVKPRFVLVVYYVFIQQDTGKFSEEVFKVPKMVCFYCRKAGIHTIKLFFKTVEAFFKRFIQSYLTKPIFYKVEPATAKAYDKNNPRRDQQHDRNQGRKSLHESIQNVPAGHILPFFNTSPSWRFGQWDILAYFLSSTTSKMPFGVHSRIKVPKGELGA
jgi:hypothetical protein